MEGWRWTLAHSTQMSQIIHWHARVSRAVPAQRLALVTLILLAVLPTARAAGVSAADTLPITLSLQPSQPSPQPVETPILWSATATTSTPLVYRFSVATSPSGPFQIVRDYSSRASFQWAPIAENTYYIEVTAKEGYTGTATASTIASFTLTSRVSGGQPVVTPTDNPLVALFSAPPCASGQEYVRFRAPAARLWTNTNVQQCQSDHSLNFLVAGMLPSTTYQIESVVTDGASQVISTPISFTTGALPSGVIYPRITVQQPASASSGQVAYMTFHSILWPWTGEVNPVVTDLRGHIIWYAYEPDLGHYYATHIQPSNTALGAVVTLQGNDGQAIGQDILRVIDLAGHPVQETNLWAIQQQLLDQGQSKIYGFSHEFYYLPNGDLATIAYVQKWIGGTSYMGDLAIVLDSNLQVVWTWNAFDYLDTQRGPTMGDKCRWSFPACPVPGGPNTVDWTHMNAVDYSPADGDLILSLRAQDWVIKVDFEDGRGDGHIVWRLGKGGDFSLVPLDARDPYPWFSHQHDANYLDGTTLTLLDNGNTRCIGKPKPPCDSRGQVYSLDEQHMVARQTANVDLGGYSLAVGTAQRLANGSYNFTLGTEAHYDGQDLTVSPTGAEEFKQHINIWEYRAWRMTSLDASINPPCIACSS